jgi:hypothetical protein
MKTLSNPVKVIYNNKEVLAQKLTVSSEIPLDIETAWTKVKTSALLEFVAKGMITFAPLNGNFQLFGNKVVPLKQGRYCSASFPLVERIPYFLKKLTILKKFCKPKSTTMPLKFGIIQ